MRGGWGGGGRGLSPATLTGALIMRGSGGSVLNEGADLTIGGSGGGGRGNRPPCGQGGLNNRERPARRECDCPKEVLGDSSGSLLTICGIDWALFVAIILDEVILNRNLKSRDAATLYRSFTSSSSLVGRMWQPVSASVGHAIGGIPARNPFPSLASRGSVIASGL